MAKSMPRQKPGRSKQDVCTPVVFLQAVKARLGIDTFAVDLAATKENTVSRRFCSKASNALMQPSWNFGGWNWLNPPFGGLEPWVQKAYEESRNGARTAMLVPAGVGANWWTDWVDKKAHVLFLNGRLIFVGHTQGYPKDCALLLFAGYKAGDLYNRDLTPGYECWTWRPRKRTARKQVA